MQVKVNLILGHYLIFYNCINFIDSKPLIGHNIRDARLNEFPFVVSLMRITLFNSDPVDNHICTGTLITRRDVVTAEHCILSENELGIQIIVGSNHLRCGRHFYIYWWITFIQWASRMNFSFPFTVNDVANIRLTMSVSRAIVPARIPTTTNEDLYGLEVMIVGWGQSNSTYLSPLLKKAKVVVWNNEYCRQHLSIVANEEMELDSRQTLCTAANPYVLLFRGDSGGPLLLQNYIIGVNKGTCPNNVEEQDPNQVNLHMSIYYYKNFLLNIIDNP